MANKQKLSQEIINKTLAEYIRQLTQLQSEIEANQTLHVNHGKIVLQLAIKAGEILNQARKLVPHKEWEKWVETNVQGIGIRTAQKYRKLATLLAIEQERVKVKKKFGGMTEEAAANHSSFLADAEGLRDAYLTAGIIKKPKMISGGATSTPQQEEEMLKKRKEENKVLYKQKFDEACIKMKKKVRADIDGETRLSWRLCDWMINGDKVRPADKTNHAANLFSSFSDWVVKREYENEMSARNEIKHKMLTVVAEVIKSFITSNPKPEDFVMELNPTTTKPTTPIEAKEMEAA